MKQLVLLASVVFVSVGCGPVQPRPDEVEPPPAPTPQLAACGAHNCDGCCDGDVCRVRSNASCGVNGSACTVCGEGQSCYFTGVCGAPSSGLMAESCDLEWSAPDPVLTGELRALHITNQSDAWVGGSDGVWHWDGGAWVPTALPDAVRSVRAVFGHSEMAIAAPADDSGTVLLWDGAAWTVKPSPMGSPVLAMGAAGVQAWIVGGVDGAGAAARWENDAFVPVPVAATEPLLGVDGDPNGNVWAVTSHALLRLKEGTFEVVAAAPSGGFSGAIRSDGEGSVWASGNAPGTLHRYLLDGSWRTVVVGSAVFQSIGGSNPDDLWAVGAQGIASHWDGEAWSEPRAIADVDLHGIRMAGSVLAWAVGDDGKLVRGTCSSPRSDDPSVNDSCRERCVKYAGVYCTASILICT